MKKQSETYKLNQNILNSLSKEVSEVVDVIPDANFAGFSIYTLLLAEVCKEFSVAFSQNSTAVDAFGYIDSGCSVLLGVSQIMQPKAEPIANRVKGITNILAGGELYWLLLLGLGPVGFVIDVGVAFLHSLYDMGKTLRRINDDDYWRHDSENKLKYLLLELEELEITINSLKENQETDSGTRKNKIFTWLLIRKENQKEELQGVISDLRSVLIPTADPKCKRADLEKELLNASYNSLMLGAAFIGLVLLTFFGGGIPAIILIAVAVVLYAYKYAPKVGAFFTDVANYLKTFSKEAFIDGDTLSKKTTNDDDDTGSETQSEETTSDEDDTDGDTSSQATILDDDTDDGASLPEELNHANH